MRSDPEKSGDALIADAGDDSPSRDAASIAAASTAAGAREPSGTEHRRRRWRLYVGVPVGLLVVIMAVPVAGYLFRSKPGAVSIPSAIRRYRDTARAAGPDEFTRPAAGVYSVDGHGEERISAPPNSQQDGSVMPVSVQHLDHGCWRWRIDYNVAHWHEYDFCPSGAQLLLDSQRNYLKWDFGLASVTNVGEYRCEPPAPIAVEHPTVGQQFQHHCVGTNSAAPGVSVADGPAQIKGFETLTIGGKKVLAIHQNRLETMTGPQKGTITEEWWFAADTGLPLKASRTYRLTTSSPIGDIDYSENGSWQLSSTVPKE